ncbi:unnamed protein product, partial [Rotaria sordida]
MARNMVIALLAGPEFINIPSTWFSIHVLSGTTSIGRFLKHDNNNKLCTSRRKPYINIQDG